MPRFVLGASPYVAPGDEPILDVLRQLTVQHEHMASKLAEAILLRGGRLPRGTYPMHYTSLHDLELRHLLTQIVEEQRDVVRFVDELTYALREDKLARRLAQEARQNETAHLRLFEELCLRYPAARRVRPAERKAAAADRELVEEAAKALRARAA
jgi:hypothetical protein